MVTINLELIWEFNVVLRLTVIPPVVFELSNIEILICHDNRIGSLDGAKLQRLSMLTTLDVSNNSIPTVPPELGLITSLK